MEHKFESAVDAIVSGDVVTLKELLLDDPSLVRARSSKDHKATLLHYIAANGVENERQNTPANAVEIAQTLIETGAEVDALSEIYDGGTQSTTLNLLLTSAHPAKAGVMMDLVVALCNAKAAANGVADDGSPLDAAVAFMYPSQFLKHQYQAAKQSIAALVQYGARLANPYAATAMGNLNFVRDYFQGETESEKQRERLTKAFIYACMCGHLEIVEFLLGKGLDINASCSKRQTGLHLAAGCGHEMVARFLVEHGADTTHPDNQYQKTPLEWAEYFEEKAVETYLRNVEKNL